MTSWPLLEAIKEELGDSLTADVIAPIMNCPSEALRVLRKARETNQPKLILPANTVRPYVTNHGGVLIRTAFQDLRSGNLPFDSYLSSICGNLILFPEIAINDPVAEILNQADEWGDEHLSLVAPALLHSVSVLEPLVERGYVRVISLSGQDAQQAKRSLYRALYVAEFGDSTALSLAFARRRLQSLADALVVGTLFSSQLQVYFNPHGLALFQKAMTSNSDASIGDNLLVAPPRIRLHVPAPDRVSISDIVRIREDEMIDRWMSELNQAVAECTQLLSENVKADDLTVFVQQRLCARQNDLWRAVEGMSFRSSARDTAREVVIGLMASLPGLCWNPELYTQMTAGSLGLTALNAMRKVLKNSFMRRSNTALQHHFEAFFTDG